jgi:acetoin utilization deacetylase AcuC-like enzyme
MGFCLLNNVAVTAAVLAARGERVAIVDWDAHHGNGTQAGFYARGDVLTVSVHMDHGSWGPDHPETGGREERGTGAGDGANLNVPLPYGAGDAALADALDRVVVPALRAFRPDAIVGACGQDASQFDPNARLNVSMAGFHRVGATLAAAADELTGGRLVLVQEGGYAQTYAALCLHETLAGASGRPPLLEDPLAYLPDVVRAD